MSEKGPYQESANRRLECCVSGVCDYHMAINDARPEILIGPCPRQVCHEHWCGVGEDGWQECCMCSLNPCDAVTVAMALDHNKYEHWRGQRDGVWLARQVLSEAIEAAVPEPLPALYGLPDPIYAGEAFGAAYALVRGDIDEPPF